MSDTVIYSLNISLKMYLRSDWFIQELRYIKYPVHFQLVKLRFLNWDVLSIQYQAEKKWKQISQTKFSKQLSKELNGNGKVNY